MGAIDIHLKSMTWLTLFLLLCVVGSSTGDKKRLNEFIKHYEELSYDTGSVHESHLRCKRSAEQNREVHINFKAHDRDFKLRLKRDTTIFSKDAVLEHSGRLHNLDTSHIYQGHLIGVPKSQVYGSLINGIFDGTIHTPSESYHVEKSDAHFGRKPQKFHSVIYADSDVTDDPIRKRRDAHEATCANSEPGVHEWMDAVQHSAIENKVETREKRSGPLTMEETWASKYKAESQQYYSRTSQHKVRSKRENRPKRTCTLYLEADPMLWQYMTDDSDDKNRGYDPERAMEEITSLFATHVNGLKNIYESHQFQHEKIGPYDGFSFVVRRVNINTDADCEGALGQTNTLCRPNIDVSNFLNINSLKNHDLYCLAYVFTYRDFTGGTLGLAWVGSPSKASGGICETFKEYNENNRRIFKSLNTGIVTLVNYGSKVPPKVSTLTFAHEVGHNFGSPHDAGGCVPSSTNPNNPDGNFIMFASATSGDRPNNSQFSPCSIGNMTLVLHAVINGDHGKKSCFVESEEAFCGNAILEQGEVCDCGFTADCNKTDQCCFPQENEYKCTLKPNAECSPSQGPCCESSCKKVTQDVNKLCQRESQCSQAAYCNGITAQCPKAVSVQELTPCNDFTQVCRSGECQGSICERIKWNQCYMTDVSADKKTDKATLCYVACQNPSTQQCVSTGDKTALEEGTNADLKNLLAEFGREDIRLQPGAPCDNFKGYCDVFQKCRGVDADGPLARLKNLLLDAETLNTIRDWIVEYWWAVLLMGVGLVIFMGLFIKVCAVHTPSSNPKKAPHRKISLKPQPRRQQGPPPGYPGAGGPSRGGPPRGRGGRGAGDGKPPPYNPHAQMIEMQGQRV